MGDKNLFRQDFASLGDLLDWIPETPNRTINKDGKPEHNASGFDPNVRDMVNPDWYGSESYKAADTLARMGWPKGRANLAKAQEAILPLAQARGLTRAQGFDVGGAYPVVPVAVAGDPVCMVTVGDQERATRPYVRFHVNIGLSSGIKPGIVTTRGAAILAWVDALEQAGARCEVVLAWGANTFGDNPALHTTIMAKRADEPLDIDRMSYALLHPSMIRRHVFAYVERACPKISPKIAMASYGRPMDVPPDMDNAVTFECMVYDEKMPHWKNNAKAAAYVRREILKACGDLNGMLDAA